MSEWQPIETAPRDGEFLVSWPLSVTDEIEIAWYRGNDLCNKIGEVLWRPSWEGMKGRPHKPTKWTPLHIHPETGED